MPRREVKFLVDWMACCKTNSNNNVKHKTGKGGERSHIDRHAKEGSEVSCGVDGMLLDKKKQLCEAKEVGRG